MVSLITYLDVKHVKCYLKQIMCELVILNQTWVLYSKLFSVLIGNVSDSEEGHSLRNGSNAIGVNIIDVPGDESTDGFLNASNDNGMSTTSNSHTSGNGIAWWLLGPF